MLMTSKLFHVKFLYIVEHWNKDKLGLLYSCKLFSLFVTDVTAQYGRRR